MFKGRSISKFPWRQCMITIYMVIAIDYLLFLALPSEESIGIIFPATLILGMLLAMLSHLIP